MAGEREYPLDEDEVELIAIGLRSVIRDLEEDKDNTVSDVMIKEPAIGMCRALLEKFDQPENPIYNYDDVRPDND